MTFPVITNISEILPALEGREEFIIANKGLYTVIDYRYVMSDSFDHPLRKECRGLKFCSLTGELLARPLHKFFNWGEKPETGLEQIDFSNDHVVMEKMDGSMIHPCLLTSLDTEGQRYDELVLMTRMGHTDVAKAAERLFLDNPVPMAINDGCAGDDLPYLINLRQALRDMVEDGFTPIFEYVGPDNRIVEEYTEPKLVLLQVRETETGVYAHADLLQSYARILGVECAPTYPAFTQHADVLAIHDRDTGGEGVVLVFDNGLFVKIKSDEYRRLHRIKDDVTREHDLAVVILDDKLDDALPLFDAVTKANVEAFRDALVYGMLRAVSTVCNLVLTASEVDQKTFATVTLAGERDSIRSIAFTVRGKNVSPATAVKDYVRKHCANAKKFEAVRDLTGATYAGAAFHMEAA